MKIALIGYGNHGKRWDKVLDKLGIPHTIFDPLVGSQDIRNAFAVYPEIDAVLVVTPHKDLASITYEALQAGKHVLCEKPGGMTSKDIKRNNELANKKGLTYMIGYNCRFHDGFIKARKLYDKGAIGKLLFIRARFGFGGRKGYEKEWRLNKEISGGGHLHDQGVHMIDMAKSFMGNITGVQGMIADTYWKTGAEDNGFVLLKSGNVIASIHSSVTQWKRMHSFEIYGDKGYLAIEGLGMRYGEPERLILGKRTKNPDVTKEKVIKCNANADKSLELELKEFLSAIKENRPTVPHPLDAYETLKGGGQITEVEGKKATVARNRMDKAQSEDEYKAAAREYQSILKQAVLNARKKASFSGSQSDNNDPLGLR